MFNSDQILLWNGEIARYNDIYEEIDFETREHFDVDDLTLFLGEDYYYVTDDCEKNELAEMAKSRYQKENCDNDELIGLLLEDMTDYFEERVKDCINDLYSEVSGIIKQNLSVSCNISDASIENCLVYCYNEPTPQEIAREWVKDNIDKIEIETLQDFADLLNFVDDYIPEMTDIIEENKWEDLTHEEFAICASEDEILQINEKGQYEVVDREDKLTKYDLVSAIIAQTEFSEEFYEKVMWDGDVKHDYESWISDCFNSYTEGKYENEKFFKKEVGENIIADVVYCLDDLLDKVKEEIENKYKDEFEDVAEEDKEDFYLNIRNLHPDFKF